MITYGDQVMGIPGEQRSSAFRLSPGRVGAELAAGALVAAVVSLAVQLPIARLGLSEPTELPEVAATASAGLLLAAEYILDAGNERVILCERGIRTFEEMTRNTVDIAAVPLLKELSHLPVIVDPSHATGRRSLVAPVARAAVAAGADGLMIEVHQDPDSALSDGPQSLYPYMLEELLRDIKRF